jgi:hypothetical protein
LEEIKAVKSYKEFELTDDEILDRKNLLMKELDKKDVLISDFEDHKNRSKSLIKTVDLTIDKLRTIIKTKLELVDVEIFYNVPTTGTKEIVRIDNSERIYEDMTEEENKQFAQINIFAEGNDAAR